MTADHFDGATFDADLDGLRLGAEMRAVFAVMLDSTWRTLEEVQQAILKRGGRFHPEAAISARLRDCRKRRFGSHTVDRRRRGNPGDGLWEYRLIRNPNPGADVTSVPLTEYPNSPDNARRDQWGRYLIVPPKGGKPVGYTRVTTVAKTLENDGGLAPWKAAMAAQGLIMRRGLRAQWEALIASHNGDPWYAGIQSKAECKRLVEECAAVGGANDRREMGSALHTITALVDLGRTPTHLTEETETDIAAYRKGLEDFRISLVPGMVEVTVVLDDHKVAGTFDRLAIVPGFELPLIADLKTGADLSYSWQSIAVQLASYSRANAIYKQGQKADGSQDQRLPMPEVDQGHGIIFWLNAGTGELAFYLVDLGAGWDAFGHSMWARDWRTGHPAQLIEDPTDLSGPPASNADDLTEVLEQSLAAVEAAKVPQEVNGDSQLSPAAAKPASEPIGPITPERHAEFLRGWLQDRINVIGRHDKARADLAGHWPKDLPTLRASDSHSAAQLTAIELLLDAVEKRWEIAFPPPRPGEPEAVAKIVAIFPGSTTTNDPTDKEPA